MVMHVPRQASIAILIAVVAALGTSLAVGALGALGSHKGSGGGGEKLAKASLAPSTPTDPAFHAVTPGAAPWVLKRGEVRLKRKGELELRVRGLVIPTAPANGTPGPVNTVSASLYCGADSEAVAADTTRQVPISRDGNARIRDRSFAVPASCLAPIVLVHPNGDTTHYIAVDGWRF
jgi:hypothetical protein